jgi:hypothetical protein
MIEIVLSHPDELRIRRVRDSRDERLVEALYRKCAYRFPELLIQAAERLYSMLPVFSRRRRT